MITYNIVTAVLALLIYVGVWLWGSWPEYLARDSDKILNNRVSKCGMIVTWHVSPTACTAPRTVFNSS